MTEWCRTIPGNVLGAIMFDKLLEIDRYTAIGLDVGTSAVKMVHLSRNGQGLTVDAAASVDILIAPDDDEIAMRTKRAAAIRLCHKQLDAPFRSRYAICGVSGPEVAARSFHLPPMEREKLEAAIIAEASDVCPFNVRQNRFDYQLAVPGKVPEGRSQNASEGQTGVMVAATNMVVNEKKSVVEAAWLVCALIDENGMAMMNPSHW